MEYVEGETLGQRLQSGRVPTREALDIAAQIASALAAAHAIGIVHRDVKPQNVMLRPDGFVKCSTSGSPSWSPRATPVMPSVHEDGVQNRRGHAVGTIAYMSPEQARAHTVDARTDVWSLGCVLYEMVAGRPPFAAQSSSDTLAAILGHDPGPVSRMTRARTGRRPGRHARDTSRPTWNGQRWTFQRVTSC